MADTAVEDVVEIEEPVVEPKIGEVYIGERRYTGELDADGNVEIISKVKCGFCMTGHHTTCVVKSSPYWGKVWVCPCGCDKSLVVKPKPSKDWFSKYKAPFTAVTDGDGKKKRKAIATNTSYVAPKVVEHVPYVPPKPRDARVDALVNEMLEDVRATEEFQAEKEKWSE